MFGFATFRVVWSELCSDSERQQKGKWEGGTIHGGMGITLEETYLLICFQHILSASTGIQARQAGLNWLPVLNFLFIYNTVDWEGRCVCVCEVSDVYIINKVDCGCPGYSFKCNKIFLRKLSMTVAHRDAPLCCLWIKALQGLHSVTFHHLCVLSWLPPFQASAEGGDPKARGLFSVTFAICCWLTVSVGEVSCWSL